MIIDDIIDAGISIAHHEDAGIFELLFAQPAACHKCGHNTSKKVYTSVRPIVDCVDGQAMKIHIKHRRFYCHNCKSYVASDDEAKLATIIEPRAKYTNAVKSFILKELIHWVDLPYREWETTFGVSKSCVENWAKTVFKKLEMSIPWLLPCRSVYCMQFFYQGINRMATLGIGENGEQYICHISEDDNDGSLHHYLELVNHKSETTKYIFVDGDVEDCQIIQASLRRMSWKKALIGDKYEINHPDDFEIINNILSNTHTSAHVILSPTSIEKIAYDNAKMANNKSQKYNDVILKKCANLGATMIRDCLGTDSTEVHKKLSDKLRSLDIELLAEEIQGDRLFDTDELVEYLVDFFMGLFDEISCAASYLYPVDFDYRFSAKVLEQIKIMESKGIRFELMALKLLLSQNSMQNWLEEQNLGDYIE